MAERTSYSESHLQRVATDTGLNFLRTISTRRGSVLVAEYKKQYVVVKIADMTSVETEINLDLPRSVGIKNEARILNMLPQSIGPKVLDYREYSDMSYLVTEYLGNIGEERSTIFHLPDPIIGISSAGEAIHRLHSAGVIHGDIQPENILFYETQGNSLQSRLIDFEHARRIDDPAHRYSGLYHYLTPENSQRLAHKGAIVTEIQDDVFAFTASCLAMLTCTYPVAYSSPGLDRNQRIDEIAQFRSYSAFGASREHMHLAQNLKNILQLPLSHRPDSINSLMEILFARLQDAA